MGEIFGSSVMTAPPLIFISYRRSDSISEAGRIYDSLVRHFGQECIYKDVFNIPYGVDFAEHLDQAVSQCQVLLAIIGPTWLTTTGPDGQRRLDHPEDFVRLEVATALRRDGLVVPVLVNGATMPAASQLPEDLRPLARRNAAQVRHDPDYPSDINRLIGLIQHHVGQKTPPSAQSWSSPAAASPTVAALSGINGCLSGLNALVNSLLVVFDPVGLVAGGGLGLVALGAALAWVGQAPGSWLLAVVAQLIAMLVSLGLMLYYNELSYARDDLFVGPGFNLIVPVIALGILVWLLRPAIRRRWRH